jgi:hypothetical protein
MAEAAQSDRAGDILLEIAMYPIRQVPVYVFCLSRCAAK